jgi:hypothetical protein
MHGIDMNANGQVPVDLSLMMVTVSMLHPLLDRYDSVDSARYSKIYKAHRQTSASEKSGRRPRKMTWELGSPRTRRFFWFEGNSGAGRHHLVRSLVACPETVS